MKLKLIDEENFNHYKKPSMVIAFPKCSFKCDKEYGKRVCQNSTLANSADIEISCKEIVERYINNNITKSIIFAGLEPFDSWEDMINLLKEIRLRTNDDIVIYTGYNKNEVQDKVSELKKYKNIIIKFGRYIPDQTPHYDETLGIYLASDNQYAEVI